MKIFCPSCGSPVEFRYDDSFVRTCDSCRSAIVRTDRGLDSFGQEADLLPTTSGLAVGDGGQYHGQPFVLSGRTQYQHPAGGKWDEWYLHFADGRWGWLAQAQGDWVVTFESSRKADLPAFEQLSPGDSVDLDGDGSADVRVGECNLATLDGGEGEIPFAFRPGQPSRFVDLGGPRGRFATLDYGPPESSEPPTTYVGRRVRLSDLGLSPREPATLDERPGAAGERLSCPNCGGSIELRLPDSTRSVACSYCGSVLDCEGSLSILSKQPHLDGQRPAIPLGSQGTFDGATLTVTGRMRRRANYAEHGTFFEWDEYLLHSPSVGYRWLSLANGHYSFVTPLSPGVVGEAVAGRVSYQGRSFSIYDDAQTDVVSVWGEFYWKVEVGQRVRTVGYVAPPASLSREIDENEEHWGLAVYKTPEEVRRAFALSDLPDERTGVAGNQPFAHAGFLKVAVALVVALLAASLLRLGMADGRSAYLQAISLGPKPASSQGGQNTYVVFTPSFELAGGRNNVRVSLSMIMRNSWAYVTADLIHEESGQFRSFSRELSRYEGVTDGERWSEGSLSQSHLLSGGEAGPHSLRLAVITPGTPRSDLRVSVQEDVFPIGQMGWTLALLLLPALLLGFYRYSFEASRWSESDFAPQWMKGSDD